MSNKVVFGLRETTEIILPVSGAAVKLYKGLTVAESREIFKKFPNAGDQTSLDAQDANIEMIKTLICEWNFIDSEGKDIPVTVDMINLLQLQDLQILSEVVAGELTKKK